MTARLTLAAWVAAAAVAAFAAGLGGTAQAALTRPETAAPPVLGVVSCTGGSFCLAAGNYSKPGDGYIPLAQVWNGRSWRILSYPAGFWSDLTCTGPSFCLAAGIHGREDVWNGKTWHKFKAQPPDPDVQCVSPAFCVTLNDESPRSGEVDWTGGSHWQAMPGTSAGCGGAWCSIQSWSCASATNCLDSGTYCGDSDCDSGEFSYTDIWNGLTWSDSTGQTGPGFSGNEACAGKAFCLTLDPPRQAAITSNRGNSWHSATAHLVTACRHLGSCLSAALPSCASPQFCLALPYPDPATGPAPAGSLIWTGTEWGSARFALVNGHHPNLTDLACGSQRNCVATGTYQASPSGTARPVAEHWNGKTWQVTQFAALPQG